MGNAKTLGTGSSVVVENCQICNSTDLQPVIFLGYLPPVNQMRSIGETPHEQPSYPAMMLLCRNCSLAQLGCIVDPEILFPPDYPYTSGTTRILRDNFAEMYDEATKLVSVGPDDLVVDIGSNDGTLLSNWAGRHRILGVEPSERANLANSRGVDTWMTFFTGDVAKKVRAEKGPAKVVTATNVFAHMEDIHSILDGIIHMLGEDGVFISESHYVVPLIETLQYDTIYHEHMRYYSLMSLKHLLEMHGLDIVHAKRIPTHGGSIRVYAARAGKYEVRSTVADVLDDEARSALTDEGLARFRRRVVQSKLDLYSLLRGIKADGKRVFGVGAPSRASTLISYVGLDDRIVDCVVEVRDSFKVGKYIPGTIIPVVDEARLFSDSPDYALLLSWHIAEELMPKLKAKGFEGDFIVPLPEPHIVRSADVS